MKKVLVLSFLMVFTFCAYAEARNVYDETGRVTIQDNTIRGRRKAAMEQAEKQKKLEAAAAAKLDYEQALKSLEKPVPKTNFYQDRFNYQ